MRRSVVAPLALLLPLAACRFDFDPVPAPEKPADAGPDAPPVLPCGSPSQFVITAPAGTGSGSGSGSGSGTPVTLTAIAASASADGYDVLAVASNGDVQGFGFAFDGPQLAPRATAPVFSNATGVVAAIDTPDGVLAAIEYDSPPTGTALIPLDAQLAPRGEQQKTTGWLTLDDTLAHNADGTVALLGTQSGSTVAKQVSSSGTDHGGSRQIVDPAETPSVPTIAGAGANFVLTWVSDLPTSPNLVRAEVIDAQMSVIVPPTTINPNPMHDGQNPRGGYAASAGLYLFAWSFKSSVTDELWVSLRDGQLNELRAFQLSTHGVQPRVIAGKDDFLVAWKDTNTTSSLAAARVQFNGSVVPLVVSGSGGKALGWDLATRAGQPALIWIDNAATPGLWLDPLCK